MEHWTRGPCPIPILAKSNNKRLWYIKIYGSVSCGQRKQGTCKQSISILTGTCTQNSWFSHIHNSVIPDPKWHQIYCEGALHLEEATFQRFLQPFPRYEQSNFQKNFFVFFLYSYSFCTLCVNRYNSHIRFLIWLKFGTFIRGLKANTSIKFGINLINIQGIISDYMHKAKLNVCRAYRLNCFEEQAENWYVAGLDAFW